MYIGTDINIQESVFHCAFPRFESKFCSPGFIFVYRDLHVNLNPKIITAVQGYFKG